MPNVEIESKSGIRIRITSDKHIIPATIAALAELAKAILPFGRAKPSKTTQDAPDSSSERRRPDSLPNGEHSKTLEPADVGTSPHTARDSTHTRDGR